MKIFGLPILTERERERVEDVIVLPLDLELFSCLDWSETKRRYNKEFEIFCSQEIQEIADICQSFRTCHELE